MCERRITLWVLRIIIQLMVLCIKWIDIFSIRRIRLLLFWRMFPPGNSGFSEKGVCQGLGIVDELCPEG
jgi:hypothetical protein